MVRTGATPDDLVIVIRAAPSNRAEVVEDIATAAMLSAEAYVVERDDGSRELLYGVSVYARRQDADPDVLARFSASPCFLEASVGLLRTAGFPVLPTGTDPDHFDVQLLSDYSEEDPADNERVWQAASKLAARAGDLWPNPLYAGGAEDRVEGSR